MTSAIVNGTAPDSATVREAAALRAPVVNAMSIDVEDWFQVSAFAPYINRTDWDSLPCRIERNVDRILELLDRHTTKATFFTLGWIAERYPQCVRRIVAQGHELASHGYGHQRVGELGPASFRDDIVRAKSMLEGIGSTPVVGYRAPSFSVSRSSLWAHDLLAETGHLYSSSIYPISHDHYGIPDAPRFAHRAQSGLVEIPASTLRLFGRNYPVSGGGYFRLLPYCLSQWSISHVNQREHEPTIFYFHPWEIDPDQPRVSGISVKTRFRHYVNLNRTRARIERLLDDLHWGRIDQVFASRLS